MRLRGFFLFLLGLYIIQSFAQKEAVNWNFGNGVSIDFSTGSDKPKVINNSELYTNEGCASISDNNGKLLFYSDGVSVWNNKNELMASGLNGANSSTQSCVILKKPGTETLYYLFTVDELAGSKGLCYSVIDMKQNGGLGAVIQKNQLLLTPTSEKLTAVAHADGKSWWVIVHKWNSDAFYSYHFDENGISNVVLSKSGTVHKDIGKGTNSSAIGYLKASANGKKLASAICYVPNNFIELFDFDNLTGTISNPVNLPSAGNAYGVCFSPDNTKLYVSYESMGRGVVQYNLQAADVPGSAVRVSPVDSTRYGALQVDPYGKNIYVAQLGQYLDVITKPNAAGKLCGFKTNYLYLDGKYSTFGLPDFFLVNHSTIKVNLGNDTVVCDNSFQLDAKNPGSKYRWSTGQTEQKITVNKSGIYWVEVSDRGQIARDSIKLKMRKPIILELGHDTVICGDIYPLDAGTSGLNYRWSSGASSQVYVATQSGKYVVTVSDGICTKTDSVNLSFPSTGTVFTSLKEFNPDNSLFNNKFDYVINNVSWFNLKVMKKGKILFETENKKDKWNGYYKGNKMPAGSYNWVLNYKVACTHEKVYVQKGIVNIVD